MHDKITGSVGPAVEIGKRLGGPAGERVQSVAKDAFVSGMHLAVVVAAAIILVAAIAVFLWLPARAPEEPVDGVRSIIVVDEPGLEPSPEPVS